MRLLDDSHWVAQVYGLVKGKSEMLKDLEIIKKTLIKIISKSHLAHPGDIKESRKAAAAHFISPYKIIFTTNYDLLLYWVAMFAGDPPPFQDCFRADEDDPDSEYLVFTETRRPHRNPILTRCTPLLFEWFSYENIAGFVVGSD